MKMLIAAVLTALPAVALAQSAPAPHEEQSFRTRLYERYCEKLRESPVAFVQFVRAKQFIYGYTYTDFAPANPGDPVRADCKVPADRIAAVHRELRLASR